MRKTEVVVAAGDERFAPLLDRLQLWTKQHVRAALVKKLLRMIQSCRIRIPRESNSQNSQNAVGRLRMLYADLGRDN